MIRSNPNKLPFNRLICHVDSELALKQANLGRIPRSQGASCPRSKTNTITKSVITMMHDMFTPKMLGDNIKTMVNSVKGNIQVLEGRVKKDLIEVVLSSTVGPGFSLNGAFASTDEKITPAHLSTAM
ncbi:hypothetical protein NUW58_g10920 [Xylaria curta]|uniref:Uncharacterized protein n=1 Tax=Xylaria curta TaxID=42375 RepID=A0ACC1MF43_9PEZI|nr:hypothetical protein NUW58_g10920 [Xylaria curta]